MFVLMVSVDYEGSDLLGLYSSVETAVAAAQRYMGSYIVWGDTMEVFHVEVDADPIDTYSRQSVWSYRR